MVGSAVATAVWSIDAISSPIATTAKTPHLPLAGAGAASSAGAAWGVVDTTSRICLPAGM
jgi:hypothetical protein